VIPSSCYDIEAAIYALFTGTDRAFAKVDLGRFPDAICPGLNVAVVSGAFEDYPDGSTKESLKITMLVAVKNLHSESERRKLVHPLVRLVVRNLSGQNLGMDIDSIQPDGWDERTSGQQFQSGESVFEVRFRTSVRIPKGPASTDEEVALTDLIASYHQVSPSGGQLANPPLATDNLDPRT